VRFTNKICSYIRHWLASPDLTIDELAGVSITLTFIDYKESV